MTEIDTHLGRDASGEAKPAYITPKKVDPSLLVPFPRIANRITHSIDPDDFCGYDRWNCYEFSTCLSSGFPLTGFITIVYSSKSDMIVESKSLKLYLNSFNLDRMSASTPDELKTEVQNRIFDDLKQLIQPLLMVRVDLDVLPRTHERLLFFKHAYYPVEGELRHYPTPAEKLDMIHAPEGIGVARYSISIRSNCKVTNQPDWGTAYIAYQPRDRFITLTSIYNLVTSFREENHFHEEVCEMLFNDLTKLVQPTDLLVACNYLRRGGIDINPIRASSINFLREETIDFRDYQIIRDSRQ